MAGNWKLADTVPPLAHNDVQVWLTDLRLPRTEMDPLLAICQAVLAPDEQLRAARMRPGTPREEFVAGRGVLRHLLGRAYARDPRSIPILVTSEGKPQTGFCEFNVSHSHGILLIALSLAGPVGIDVERIGRDVDLLGVAATAFRAADLARIEAHPTEEGRRDEFYRCWTMREAVAKADGRGLTLKREDIQFAGSETRMVTATVTTDRQLKTFHLKEIEVDGAFRAALAHTGREINLLQLTLPANAALFSPPIPDAPASSHQ